MEKRDLRMYILVNKNLNMSVGKACGQVGHAVASYFYKSNDKNIDEYMSNEQKKIILACPQNRLEELEKEGYISIRDKGYTEIEPNSLTCVNYGIVDYSKVGDKCGYDVIPKWIRRLRLY